MRKVDEKLPCRWRGIDIGAKKFLCHSTYPTTPHEASYAICLGCYFRDHEPLTDFQDTSKNKKSSTRHVSCRYLGPKTNELKDSIYCGSLKNIPLYECALLGRCTPEVKLAGYRDKDGTYVEVPWCPSCEKYEELKEETTLFPLIQVTNPTPKVSDHSE